MRNLERGVAILAFVALTACGSTSSVAHSSPSASASASASATPSGPSSQSFPSPSPGTTAAVQPVSLACRSAPAAGQHLALVTLRGSNNVVVRDITDPLHGVSRCSFNGGSYFRFYDATHVSYVAGVGDLGAPGALYLTDLVAGTTSLVRAWSYGGFGAWVYAWSPDGRYLSYITSDSTSYQWHLLSARGDRMLLKLGPVPGRGVDPNSDDQMVGFSADGKYVAVEQTFVRDNGSGGAAPPIQVNRVSDGSVVYSRTDGTMAAWAGTGAKLYFRTTAGVQAWSAGGVATVLGGISWIRPYPSPDGSRMAYSVLNAQGNHVGQVLDLTNGSVHALSANPRTGAAFLNANLVWYMGEAICTTATPCGLGGPPLTGQTYIYDLASDVETTSIDTGLSDSWPHIVGQS